MNLYVIRPNKPSKGTIFDLFTGAADMVVWITTEPPPIDAMETIAFDGPISYVLHSGNALRPFCWDFYVQEYCDENGVLKPIDPVICIAYDCEVTSNIMDIFHTKHFRFAILDHVSTRVQNYFSHYDLKTELDGY